MSTTTIRIEDDLNEDGNRQKRDNQGLVDDGLTLEGEEEQEENEDE